MPVRALSGRFALLLSCALVLCACSSADLYSELDERQANEVQAALIDANIDSSKRRSADGKAWIVSIAPDKVADAMRIMEIRGLPRIRYNSLGDIFSKEGMVSSPQEERARYIHALQHEMADTISRIDGVIDVRVNIALPEKSPLQSETPSGSAAVVIIEEPGANLSERMTDITAILKDGVEGLNDSTRVTVKVFTRASAGAASTETAQLPRNGISRLSASVVGLLLVGGIAAVGALAWLNRQAILRRRRRTDEIDRANA